MTALRVDLFTAIHKAIRSIIYETGSKLQSADFRDTDEEQRILKTTCEHLKMMKSHGEHEDNNIFNRLREYDHDTANLFFSEHHEIHSKYERITALIKEMIEAPLDKKLGYGFLLNRSFNDFAAFYLIHMNKEEEVAIAATQKYFNDEELIEMRTNIQKSIPPEIYNVWMQYMFPSLTNIELAGILKGMKAGAPVEIFERTSGLAKEMVGNERWYRIAREAEI